METKTFHQSLDINARPEEVFETFLDERKHAKLIKATAKIEPKEGGKFSLWDGDISGVTVKIEKGKRILQVWRSSDWEKGHISTVEFEFYQAKNGTKLVLVHKGVPADQYEKIEKGWKQFYFHQLEEAFNK